MKWAIASYLWLVEELKDELHYYDFGIMITSDEEIGSVDGMKPLVEQEGYRPQVAVVPDSGENWQFERFAKGVQWVKLEADGVPAHASRPWEGESAIHRLLEALREIKELSPQAPQGEDTFISVGTIEGGTVANQIPTAASAMLDIRYGAMDDFRELYPRIEVICAKYGVRTTVFASEPPVSNDMDDPLIKPFWDAVAEATGETPGTSYSYAATDGRFFSPYVIPCVVVSPPGGGRHKDDEWLSSKGYDQFCVALRRYMTEVAQKKDTFLAK
jgi:succinyl-diaminopimelate desuccinylase